MADSLNKNSSVENANDPAHYKLIVIGIVVGMIGVLLRFTGTWAFIDAISNILFIIGTYLAIKAVLRILK